MEKYILILVLISQATLTDIIIINKRYYNPSSQYSTGSDTFINAIKDIVALFSNNHSILLISINNINVREIPNIGRFDINYQTYNIEY